MRKRNYSVYEISTTLREEGIKLSATAVREVLSEEGFAPLSRRLYEERAPPLGPTVEAVADVRSFVLPASRFTTRVASSSFYPIGSLSALTALLSRPSFLAHA